MVEDMGPVSKRVIVYIGDDNNYWNIVKKRFMDLYPAVEFDFVIFSEENFNLESFVELVKLGPKIIYIDLSKKIEGLVELGKLIKDEVTFSDVPFVGLVDSKEISHEVSDMRTDFIHIKCGEYGDVVYDPCYMAFSKEVKKPDFPVAKFAKDVELIEDVRIIYITPVYIRVECNYRLSVGDVVMLETSISKQVSPSQNFVVKGVSASNLLMSFLYSYDLEFVFVDRPVKPEEEDENTETSQFLYKEKMVEYENSLKISRKKCRQWVVDSLDVSALWKVKVLIVDSDMSIFRDQDEIKRLYEEYHFRFQTKLSTKFKEVETFKSGFYIIQFPTPPVLPKGLAGKPLEQYNKIVDQMGKEALDQLDGLIRKIKSMEDYQPFIVVFNSKIHSSDVLQKSFKYPLILANFKMMDLDYVRKLIDMYEKKLKGKNCASAVGSEEELRYYIKPAHKLSHASITHQVILQSMTESELTFYTHDNFASGTYNMNFPVPMLVTLVRDENGHLHSLENGWDMYRGLLHSTGEEDKKRIRQFVNEIFFTELNEKRERESDEFKRLNEKAKNEQDESTSES